MIELSRRVPEETLKGCQIRSNCAEFICAVVIASALNPRFEHVQKSVNMKTCGGSVTHGLIEQLEVFWCEPVAFLRGRARCS